MEEVNLYLEDCSSLWCRFRKKIRKMLYKAPKFVTCDEAYCITTYGRYDEIDDMIARQQARINEKVSSKLAPARMGDSKFNAYTCIVDLAPDLSTYSDKIFKPFIDRGFKVVNLSERVEEIADDNVYLLSWYKAKDSKIK